MPLVLVQKSAIRIINKAGFRDHTNPLFVKSGLLKLKDIIDLQTLLVMLKARLKSLPGDLQKLFVFTSEDENHRRRYDFKPPYARTTLKQMFLTVVGVSLWNSQNNDLKSCKNTFEFKWKYKTNQLKVYQND